MPTCRVGPWYFPVICFFFFTPFKTETSIKGTPGVDPCYFSVISLDSLKGGMLAVLSHWSSTVQDGRLQTSDLVFLSSVLLSVLNPAVFQAVVLNTGTRFPRENFKFKGNNCILGAWRPIQTNPRPFLGCVGYATCSVTILNMAEERRCCPILIHFFIDFEPTGTGENVKGGH